MTYTFFCILIKVQIIFVTLFTLFVCVYIYTHTQSYFVRLHIFMFLPLFRTFCILIQLLWYIFILYHILLLSLINIQVLIIIGQYLLMFVVHVVRLIRFFRYIAIIFSLDRYYSTTTRICGTQRLNYLGFC